MQTTEYPIVTKETRVIMNSEYWNIIADIVNLGICKIVTLNIFRKKDGSITTVWTDLFTDMLPNDLKPSVNLIVGDGVKQITYQLLTNGTLQGVARSQITGDYAISFTYVTNKS